MCSKANKRLPWMVCYTNPGAHRNVTGGNFSMIVDGITEENSVEALVLSVQE